MSSDTTFNGTTNKVTPFFPLKKGPAKFTMHQNQVKGPFAARLEINLVNADTGVYVGNLCHNATEPNPWATVDVPVAGNYILQVSGGDTWDVSYAQ